MRIFWAGFPGPCGGANTECWHTAKLLREHGVEITFLPTAGADLNSPTSMKDDLLRIGCDIQQVKRQDLKTIDGIGDSVVVSMCNNNFLRVAKDFRDLGCRVVWVNCMTLVYRVEIAHYTGYGKTFDAYVFQSDWQRAKVEKVLEKFGYSPEQGHLIRGAFDVSEYPFRPRVHWPKTRLVVGRLARGMPDKWSSNHWPILLQAHRLIEARCMAWSDPVERKLKRPPDVLPAVLLKSCEEPVSEFLAACHCLLAVNGGAGENWPRTGLEAMAAGVPIIAQGQWGWKEMIEHGRTGLLADPQDEFNELADHVREFYDNEELRMHLALEARREVAEVHANPERIWPKWETLLKELGA